MCLTDAAPSISTFCINGPRALGRQEKEKERSECPARISGKGNMSKRHAAAGLMHNRVDLPSRHSGQCEIGAHLPYLIFLGK